MIVVPAETLLDEAIGQGLGLAKKIALKMADADHVKKLSGPEALLLFVDAIKLHETQHESENGRQEKGGRFGCYSRSQFRFAELCSCSPKRFEIAKSVRCWSALRRTHQTSC